ncbi:hypothetical protein N7465_012007 [Penicillium sp. CMV-2018d]|nr:hypothetical protein N7465_012007 [Penicillium sp. CMV-2018d]
MPWAIASIFIA